MILSIRDEEYRTTQIIRHSNTLHPDYLHRLISQDLYWLPKPPLKPYIATIEVTMTSENKCP